MTISMNARYAHPGSALAKRLGQNHAGCWVVMRDHGVTRNRGRGQKLKTPVLAIDQAFSDEKEAAAWIARFLKANA